MTLGTFSITGAKLYATVGATIAAALFLWWGISSYNDSLRKQGYEKCQAEYKSLQEQAGLVQLEKAEEAKTEHTNVVIEQVTVYMDRVKEVVRYEKPEELSACLPDPDFVRLYNQGRGSGPSGSAGSIESPMHTTPEAGGN